METNKRKNVSGLANGSPVYGKTARASIRWQPDQPDFTALSWPRRQPDLLSIPQHQLEQLMLRAREFDPKAIERFAILAIPIAKHYSCLPNVVAVLGKDEAYSIASHTLMDFLMHERLRHGRPDIPTMLKQAIRCDLLNQMDRAKNRRRFETGSRPGTGSQPEDDDAPTDFLANLPADHRLEPEHQALLSEQKRIVRECLRHLSPKEKQVIHGIYFRQQSVAEIAAELHCSANSISLAKSSALKKLRKLFTKRQIS